MTSPERLPVDQRAVLQLVLGQRRSYEQIAAMLSIAPDEVRDRARAGLDALGPPTAVSDDQRGRITDFLLGQLPAGQSNAVRDTLGASPAARAWARVVSSELAPLASEPLPALGDEPTRSADDPQPAAADRAPAPAGTPAPEAPRSSRAGGIVLLSVLAAAVIAAIVIFVFKPGSGSSSPPHSDPVAATHSSATRSAANGSSSTTTSSSQSAHIVAEINLQPPDGGKLKGTAFVLAQGSVKGLGVEAVNVPANTTKPRTAYAVWLYNSPTDATRLGFVDPGVGHNGKLAASAKLPADAARYRLLVITLETGSVHKRPGPVVLEGKLSDIAHSKL